MELRQLEYFVAVVEEASFTRAAARVHVAQPGVSAQVRRLERELGQPLLDRSGRGVTPTAAGEAVLPFARAALAAVAGAREAVDELAGLVRGHVTVGVLPALATQLDVAGLLADFHDAHPGVEIALTEDASDAVLDGVREGRVDLALAGIAAAVPDGIAVATVTEERLVAVVAPGDSLAVRATTTLGALADRPLVCLPRGTSVRALLEDAWARAGARPRIAFEASAPPVLVRLAARGLGVAIVPESAAQAPDVRAVPLRPALHGRVVLAWRADGPSSPAARALLGLARERLVSRP